MKVLVLAGGFDQIQLINELKKRGHYVILADYFENPPAKKYANEHYVVSTLDMDKIYELAKKEQVDLITTACTDQALLTVAYVSEKLQLPTYIDYQTALNVTNKLYMKKVMKENQIPTADYQIINDSKEAEKLNLNYPVVVKPVDCNSSKGVKKVCDEIELQHYLKQAIQMSRTKNAIIEQFNEGVEISIDAFVKEGVSKVLSVTKTCKLENHNNFTIYKSEYPCQLAENRMMEIENIVQNIAKAFQLENCPLLVQAIINEKEIKVLEFSARMGGGTKYRLIQEISSIDIMKIYVDLILNDNIELNLQKSKEQIQLHYVYCIPGIIQKLVGFEEAKNKKLIIDYFQYKTEGTEITKMETSGDRVVGCLIKGTTDKIHEKEKELKELLKIFDEKGNNMMLYHF